MSTPISDLRIDRLGAALNTAFHWITSPERIRDDDDYATAWTDLVASGLDGVRITATPAIDQHNPPFPFLATHRIEARAYTALRSGGLGGPRVDVLLQIRFDTEDCDAAFGVPLVFERVRHLGRMPDMQWLDLQDTCRALLRFTPSARVVFISKDDRFAFLHNEFRQHESPYVFALDALLLAGLRLPPVPARGRTIDRFCHDLASGWIGDPALSGVDVDSPVLDSFLRTFRTDHVLRILIRPDTPMRSEHSPGLWPPNTLPRDRP